MKTVKIIPGTQMTANIQRLKDGDNSAIDAIKNEAVRTLEDAGYEGETAVLIGGDFNLPVPSRIVEM